MDRQILEVRLPYGSDEDYMELILIRHGESEANAITDDEKKIYIGRWDCALTEKGRQQALGLRGHPELQNADAWYCSDLKRAEETARLMGGCSIIPDSRLAERSLGDFEGRRVEEIKNSPLYREFFTDPALSLFRHSFSAKAPNGENYSDVSRRVSSFLKDLDRGLDRVVIVSHFCVIRCIIKEVNCLSEEETLNLKAYHCDPLVVEYDD